MLAVCLFIFHALQGVADVFHKGQELSKKKNSVNKIPITYIGIPRLSTVIVCN